MELSEELNLDRSTIYFNNIFYLTTQVFSFIICLYKN